MTISPRRHLSVDTQQVWLTRTLCYLTMQKWLVLLSFQLSGALQSKLKQYPRMPVDRNHPSLSSLPIESLEVHWIPQSPFCRLPFRMVLLVVLVLERP